MPKPSPGVGRAQPPRARGTPISARNSAATTPRVNARDRIGAGPWYNVKGQLIASNVADLHGDQQRDRNNIQKATVLDVKGNEIPE